jgi:hypothetical protein
VTEGCSYDDSEFSERPFLAEASQIGGRVHQLGWKSKGGFVFRATDLLFFFVLVVGLSKKTQHITRSTSNGWLSTTCSGESLS